MHASNVPEESQDRMDASLAERQYELEADSFAAASSPMVSAVAEEAIPDGYGQQQQQQHVRFASAASLEAPTAASMAMASPSPALMALGARGGPGAPPPPPVMKVCVVEASRG